MISNFPPDKLRRIRLRAQLSQVKACELAGINRNVISYLEQGQRVPRESTLRRILTIYEMQIRLVERQEKLWDEK